jgi:hypothetical protein
VGLKQKQKEEEESKRIYPKYVQNGSGFFIDE